MTEQVANPLKFWCAPNQATPDYVIYDDFRSWIAYGLRTCWLGSDGDDPNSDCYMARPVTREDVRELRGYFLNLVETVIVTLWKGQYKPGDGCIDGDWQSLVIGNSDENPGEEEAILTWYVRLDDDAMMFELDCTGSDPVAIWLSYDAIGDRQNVLKVLIEARKTLAATGDQSEVWPKLAELVENDEAVFLAHTPERHG
jgi:hypothetical protein